MQGRVHLCYNQGGKHAQDIFDDIKHFCLHDWVKRLIYFNSFVYCVSDSEWISRSFAWKHCRRHEHFPQHLKVTRTLTELHKGIEEIQNVFVSTYWVVIQLGYKQVWFCLPYIMYNGGEVTRQSFHAFLWVSLWAVSSVQTPLKSWILEIAVTCIKDCGWPMLG